jgi:uncharacterized protein
MIVEDQREIIDFLSAPATYSADIVHVERIDTHSASIFLAGDRAYKLKRAVRYDYLDFSTRDIRHAACEAEVALNRRTAPQLYLGVLAVTRGADGHLGLAGDGTPVDWLVHMARFDQAALLDGLAARGELNVGLMPRLAAAIAGLHQAAAPRTDHGGHAGLSWVIEGNATGLAEHGGDLVDRTALDHFNTCARAALADRRDQLEDRRRAGWVRVCHGDLHLGNIVLIGDHPTLFDGVEFNDEISCIDVVYDVAFLLMDLWRLHLRAHANVLFNEYLTATGHLDAVSLLPLFLSCRSAVRAKTSVTATRLQSDPLEARRLAAAARDYLELAVSLLQPAPPRLVAVGGWSGSGKSTLAQRLAPDVGGAPGAVLLRTDVLRKTLCGVDPTTRLGADAYERPVTERVYRELAERATVALRAGHAVVLDAVFGDPTERVAMAEVARAAGVPFTGLWLEAPTDVMASRVERRQRDASDATIDVLRQQTARGTGPLDWIRLDASGTREEVQRRAEDRLHT